MISVHAVFMQSLLSQYMIISQVPAVCLKVRGNFLLSGSKLLPLLDYVCKQLWFHCLPIPQQQLDFLGIRGWDNAAAAFETCLGWVLTPIFA